MLLLLGMPLGIEQASPRETSRSPHGTLAIPCVNCHTFSGWKPLRGILEFNHNTTRYPLRGLHEGVACRQCHTNLVFTNVGTKCSDCHADIHRRQFGAQCEQCHTVKGWGVSVQSVRRHQNRFPLLGAHAVLACDSCHKGAATGRFEGLPTECVACHLAAFQQAKVPDHQAGGLPTTCEACHTMDAWQGAKFDHGTFTGFTLTGAHARLDCSACHVGGRFQGTSANCFSCHSKDYSAAQNPDHVKAGFPQDCARCHTTASWLGARFDHNAFTQFPLTGAHLSVACSQCHINGRFAGTPRDCASCHLPDFQKTTNPNHVAAGFPTDCSLCHSTAQWTGAKFDHSRTRFPLTGAHTRVACLDCHIGGRYTGTPTDCYSCHKKEYTTVTNPNHVAAGFSTNCALCHTTSTWTGASFNHMWFPIYSGVHKGKWTTCNDCHVNPSNFAVFSCFACHAHEKTRMDEKHRNVPNYVYNSANCYSCHPLGRKP